MQMVEVDVGIKCRAGEEREHTHGRAYFRIGHQRQVEQAFDRSFAKIAPNCVILGLNLLASGMRRHFDVEKPQTLKCAANTVGLFRFDNMQNDLETVCGRFVDSRPTFLDQKTNEFLGFIEVSAEEFTFRAFEPQCERELVLTRSLPALATDQGHSGGKVNAGRGVSRRSLRHSSSAQV